MTTTAISGSAIERHVTIESFKADRDGCVAYLVIDDATHAALAIDPRVDQVEDVVHAVTARGARLAFVLDTHTHADHLSGVRRLAERTGAQALVHPAAKVRFAARRVEDGETFALGSSEVKIIHAPGHTPDSLAVLVGGNVFTGDALFVGGAGRTDFMGGSASALFDTFRKLEALPDGTIVRPGHDYQGKPTSTLGAEKAHNPLLKEKDRAALIAKLDVKGEPPANMAAILRHNLGEADAATVTPEELMAAPGAFLLDVRSPLEFESERIEGARNVPLEVLEQNLDAVPDAGDVFVICRTGVRATVAAETLARLGKKTRVLEGGVLGWRKAGHPLREGKKRLPVDRQVQLIVGISVLIGTALGAFVSPWFLAIPAFFGSGLTFAGASGTCGLAFVLMRMPWNQLPGASAAGSVCAVGGAKATCSSGGK